MSIKKPKVGDEVYVRGTMIGTSGISTLVRVDVGTGFHRVSFFVPESYISLPEQKEIDKGDTAMWNHSRVKVLCIDGNDAWVRLYQPSDSPDFPTGSSSVCHNYRTTLRW